MHVVIYNYIYICGGDGSVGIAIRYWLDGPGIETRWGLDFPHRSRLVVGPNQPPIQWSFPRVERIPVGARFSAPVQTGPGAHPASCKMGTGSLPGVKICRGVLLTTYRLLVPWSRKSRAIPLLLLWAVRPVQSLCACTRVHFTFTGWYVRRAIGTASIH